MPQDMGYRGHSSPSVVDVTVSVPESLCVLALKSSEY
jgi:hypothetical protein